MGGRRWATWGLLAMAAGGLGWRAWTSADQSVPEVSSTVPQAASASSAASATLAAGRVSPVAMPERAEASLSPPPSRTAEAPDVEMEICGLRQVSNRRVDSLSLLEKGQLMRKTQALDRRKDAAMSQLSARLAVGSDSEQVAARLLMDDAEGAALIATRSRDGVAYRLAMLSCAKPQTVQVAPSCKALNAQTWAQLDATDARPWLRLLSDAMARRDDAAAVAALEQVLQRHKSRSRPLIAAVSSALASVDDRVGLGLAMDDIIGRDAALTGWDDMGPMGYCSREGLRDGARRLRCERTARWQFEQADSLMDATLALGLADRLGWPADQRPYTREQLKQGRQRVLEQSTLFDLSCAGLVALADGAAQLVQRSELQLALQTPKR